MTDDIIDAISKALRRAFQLGQTYWQQAYSESWTQQAKSDGTQKKFEALIDETRALLSSSTPAVDKGWRKGKWGYQTLFNAIGDAVSVRSLEAISISVEAFETSMLAASPQPSPTAVVLDDNSRGILSDALAMYARENRMAAAQRQAIEFVLDKIAAQPASEDKP